MTNPCARRSDIFTESVAAETILYDKANHRAHNLNRTVALVWESADGQRTIDDIAAILHRELGIPPDRGIVLLALQELAGAGLLEEPVSVEAGPELLSRRQVARKLALAGASLAMLPVVASVLAPTPAMASSLITPSTAQQDLNQVGIEALKDPAFFYGPEAQVAQTDFANATADFLTGKYSAEIQQLDGVIKALGLPPL